MRIDATSKTVTTPYGQAVSSPEGLTFITATPDELKDWANRDRWPCSELARCTEDVDATFAANGDLIDLSDNLRDVPGDEFSAWSGDVLSLALSPTAIHPFEWTDEYVPRKESV